MKIICKCISAVLAVGLLYCLSSCNTYSGSYTADYMKQTIVGNKWDADFTNLTIDKTITIAKENTGVFTGKATLSSGKLSVKLVNKEGEIEDEIDFDPVNEEILKSIPIKNDPAQIQITGNSMDGSFSFSW